MKKPSKKPLLDDRLEIPARKIGPKTLHWPGEPERVCANCEHFDGGGLQPDGSHVNASGDCHNGISGKFQTHAKDLACARGFYPCTTRFPLHVRLGVTGGDVTP